MTFKVIIEKADLKYILEAIFFKQKKNEKEADKQVEKFFTNNKEAIRDLMPFEVELNAAVTEAGAYQHADVTVGNMREEMILEKFLELFEKCQTAKMKYSELEKILNNEDNN